MTQYLLVSKSISEIPLTERERKRITELRARITTSGYLHKTNPVTQYELEAQNAVNLLIDERNWVFGGLR